MTAAARSAIPDAVARLGRQPGFRTLSSRRFRLLIGLLLLAVGLLFTIGLLVAIAPAGGFEIDFVAAYRRASLALLDGRSPYFADQLAAPFPANGRYGWYLYPPVLAQVLTPLAVLPASVGAVLWLALQSASLFGAAWLGASAAGAPRTIERAIWTGVAVTLFLPDLEVLWTGNLGGPLALSVGALLAARRWGSDGDRRGALAAGLLAGAVALIKLAPLAWLPAALRSGGGLARGSLLAVAGLLIPSLVLAPQAWIEYAHVLGNLIAGDVHYAHNLAPAIVAYNLGLPDAVVDVVRIAAILLAITLLAASVRLSGSTVGWPAAVGCAVLAGMLLPAALWYHYLALLLPLAAFVWVHAGASTRAVLVGSGVLTSAGMTVPLMAAIGAGAMAVALVVALRPAPRGLT